MSPHYIITSLDLSPTTDEPSHVDPKIDRRLYGEAMSATADEAEGRLGNELELIEAMHPECIAFDTKGRERRRRTSKRNACPQVAGPHHSERRPARTPGRWSRQLSRNWGLSKGKRPSMLTYPPSKTLSTNPLEIHKVRTQQRPYRVARRGSSSHPARRW